MAEEGEGDKGMVEVMLGDEAGVAIVQAAY